jgi:hypothetical protein
MSYVNDELIIAYKETRNMIAQKPDEKERILIDYIDLVNKINNNYQQQQRGVSGYNNHNAEFSKMLKNPLEISIYNNFQRYNDDGEPDNIINPILNKNIANKKTQRESLLELVELNNMFKNNNN